MEKAEIKAYFEGLPGVERELFLEELNQIAEGPGMVNLQRSRREILDNKQGCCAHCGHTKYVKFGRDKGAQRYKCKSCGRSFTEYSGTWMDGLHHKDKIDAYLKLMLEEKSLDKIKEALSINKKTAFDWRHKILSSPEEVDKDKFEGITESDETFLLHSGKGKEQEAPRKRGGASSKKGINDEHVAIIVTMDRKGGKDFGVATMGRLKKKDIENAIGERLCPKTVPCTGSHVSFKGFAMDNGLEHHPLRSDLKQRVKQGVYHIQHVNSAHNRLKKWIDEKFWGVATKYLQNYLNWFRVKEYLKGGKDFMGSFAQKCVQDIGTYQRYRTLQKRYDELLSTQ